MKRFILTILIIASVFIVSCTPSTVNSEDVQDVPGVLIVPSTSSSSSNSLHVVILEDGRFNPANLVIEAGDSVEWINHDQPTIAQDIRTGDYNEVEIDEYEDNRRGFDHTISFEDITFDRSLPFGGSAEHRFTESGEFRYSSLFNYHSGGGAMQGVIVVR